MCTFDLAFRKRRTCGTVRELASDSQSTRREVGVNSPPPPTREIGLLPEVSNRALQSITQHGQHGSKLCGYSWRCLHTISTL